MKPMNREIMIEHISTERHNLHLVCKGLGSRAGDKLVQRVAPLVEGPMVLRCCRVKMFAVRQEHKERQRYGQDDSDEDSNQQSRIVLWMMTVNVKTAHVVRTMIQLYDRLTPHCLWEVAPKEPYFLI